ncbi:MAG: 30S ribosome-binding factor RbfA [Planctomycetota bacterium]|jgi:ribosome-binding factor A
MASRRQQKVARVIMESVSKMILNGLSDPRITGLISVTEVDVAPNLKHATVFLSILAEDDRKRDMSFKAICRASGPFQAQLGQDLTAKFCPHLTFKLDDKVKKTLETLRLIEQAEQEYMQHDSETDPGDAETEFDSVDTNEGQ